MCRQSTIMAADGSNIDAKTMVYLQKYFPKEVKIKQKESEIQDMIDKGLIVEGERPCILM